MIYVHDSFATIADVYNEIPSRFSTERAQMTYPKGMAAPAIDSTATTGRAIGSTRASPQASTRQNQEDSTASFREEMGIQDPQGALTMEELLDHEGSVWVVLKQHNRSNSRLLAVFGCPVNAQFYAKTHRGFQKRYDSHTMRPWEGGLMRRQPHPRQNIDSKASEPALGRQEMRPRQHRQAVLDPPFPVGAFSPSRTHSHKQ
eukprot:scaffold66527_cov60-Attheya_sp.AAC.2